MSDEQRRARLDYQNAWRKAHPEKGRARQRALYAKDPERAKDYIRKARYGVPMGWFAKTLSEQGGTCPICLSPLESYVAIDHDHNCCSGNKSCGRCVRGLLCNNCNRALGMFGDDIENLVRAIGYLRHYGTQ